MYGLPPLKKSPNETYLDLIDLLGWRDVDIAVCFSTRVKWVADWRAGRRQVSQPMIYLMLYKLRYEGALTERQFQSFFCLK